MRPAPKNKIIYIVGEMIGVCKYLGNETSKKWKRYADFECHCGAIFHSEITRVKSKHTKSCGCNLAAHLIRMNGDHFMSKTPEYNIWTNMKQRCENVKNKRYADWGGRGIKVCDRWKESFKNFYEDMGDRPSILHELDRFPDQNGDYEPSNARWATKKDQALNRRSNFMVEYKGVTKPLKQWTDELNLSYTRISQRIRKLKWPINKAFETKK